MHFGGRCFLADHCPNHFINDLEKRNALFFMLKLRTMSHLNALTDYYLQKKNANPVGLPREKL